MAGDIQKFIDQQRLQVPAAVTAHRSPALDECFQPGHIRHVSGQLGACIWIPAEDRHCARRAYSKTVLTAVASFLIGDARVVIHADDASGAVFHALAALDAALLVYAKLNHGGLLLGLNSNFCFAIDTIFYEKRKELEISVCVCA
jgi:hypothetical protein